MGSMTDEPIFWADLHRQARAHTTVGVLVEQSLVGETLPPQLPRGVPRQGHPHRRRGADRRRPPRTSATPVRKLHEAKARGDRALRLRVRRRAASTPRSSELGWDPPRFMGTAFQNAWINPIMWNAILGWTGLDQYDEGNQVGQAVPRPATRRAYGRRPEYCVPVVNRDLATVLLHAFADAHPLSPRGVKEALERVKMLPAASGAPGHPPLVRQVDPPGLDGRRLPRGPPARSRRRDRRTSSTASGRTDGHDDRAPTRPPAPADRRRRARRRRRRTRAGTRQSVVWAPRRAGAVRLRRRRRVQRAPGRGRRPDHATPT